MRPAGPVDAGKRTGKRRGAPFRWLRAAVLLVLCVAALPDAVQGQGDVPAATAPAVPVLRTESARETVASFAALSEALAAAVADYVAAPSRSGVARIDLILANLRGTIDLEPVPAAGRRRAGDATVLALLDIFARVPLPAPSDLPAAESFDEAETAALRLAGTPLRLVRIETGIRAGEWLFDAHSVTTAPRFLAGIAELPPEPDTAMGSWTDTLPQLTGPRVPARVAAAMPEGWRTQWNGMPIWKAAILAAATALAGAVLALAARWSAAARARGGRGQNLLRIVPPVLALLFLQWLLPRLARQLMPFSLMPDGIALVTTILTFAAAGWLFWSAVQALAGLRIHHARRPVDGELVRVVAAMVGATGLLVIATAGAQALGIPVLSLAAGLGIGGLAVALAVRPTLENLVGGLLLYFDRPVRIGDFCTFGDHSGTVERIGVRAVWVRALDRTLIAIPNARFADMELVNWAACDMMLIHATLQLRFETTADQLRYVLAEIRRMLHAHPRIDDDTIRIRYTGPGATAREIDLRFYARTKEWNDFFAIREDAFLRIDEILQAAGVRYGLPAQVLHLARDPGADPQLRQAAEAQVDAWRREGALPFPKFSGAQLAAFDDTLDYPPAGSPDAGSEGIYRAATPETLSQQVSQGAPDSTEEDRPRRE